jgi:hypothetical protein
MPILISSSTTAIKGCSVHLGIARRKARNAQIAADLSNLAEHDDASRLPQVDRGQALMGHAGCTTGACCTLLPADVTVPEKRKVGGSTPPLTTRSVAG